MMILFWILLGVAIYYLMKDDSTDKQKNKNKKNATEVLKLRFVNGEIDQETYKRTLEVIEE